MKENDACRHRICSAIVEDERDLIWIYRRIFERIGVPVSFVATDGCDALAMFRASVPKPQVVIMDNRLPGMCGVDVTREMVRIQPDILVIFVSGDTGARDDALNAGAFLFLEKPAGLREIIGAVESALSYLPVAGMPADPGTRGEIGSL